MNHSICHRILVALAVSFGAGVLHGELMPAGVQFHNRTFANESYDPARIPKRLAEINARCTTRLLSGQFDREYAYIGSLAGHAPLNFETVRELMNMADIRDSTLLNIPGMDRALRWTSPAANVLLYACEEHLPKMEEVLHEYQGKPQHPFLQEVINDMKMEIAIRERDAQKRAMPRPQKKSVQPPTADTTATALPPAAHSSTGVPMWLLITLCAGGIAAATLFAARRGRR